MEPIKKELLEANRLRTKRRVAAMIIKAMAEVDGSFVVIDEKLRQNEGTARAYLDALIDGTTEDLDIISDIAYGIDCDLHFQATKIPTPQEE